VSVKSTSMGLVERAYRAPRASIFHEPQRAAGILPAVEAWLCRNADSTVLVGVPSFCDLGGELAFLQ